MKRRQRETKKKRNNIKLKNTPTALMVVRGQDNPQPQLCDSIFISISPVERAFYGKFNVYILCIYIYSQVL